MQDCVRCRDREAREAKVVTARELACLQLAAKGYSNKMIAASFGISDQTVKNHISAILRKLNANDRTHAVCLALERQLLQLENREHLNGPQPVTAELGNVQKLLSTIACG